MNDAELMRLFISMGCDCELGSVQRQCRAEPPDLLRWAGTDLPTVITMLKDRFQHIGDPRYLTITSANTEFFVANSHYGFEWHAWVLEGEMSPERLLKREIARLPRQADILIDDLTEGQRIAVRKARDESEADLLDHLVTLIGFYGRTQILFVSEDAEKAGSVERVGPTLLRGYVEQFADSDNIMANADPALWLPICRKAAALIPEI